MSQFKSPKPLRCISFRQEKLQQSNVKQHHIKLGTHWQWQWFNEQLGHQGPCYTTKVPWSTLCRTIPRRLYQLICICICVQKAMPDLKVRQDFAYLLSPWNNPQEAEMPSCYITHLEQRKMAKSKSSLRFWDSVQLIIENIKSKWLFLYWKHDLTPTWVLFQQN